MAYLKLFHGRKDPAQSMDDWGEQGPVFGPFPFVHTTYAQTIHMGDDCRALKIVDGLIYYDGLYYGDWSVFDGPPEDTDRDRWVEYDESRAEP